LKESPRACIHNNQRDKEMPFYENQRRTSDLLIQGIQQGKRHQVLVAQMQSGKTSTYFMVAFRALYMGLVSDVCIYTGNRENELKDQCLCDFEDKRDEFVDYLRETGFEGETAPVLKKIRDHTRIYWGQDLSRAPPIMSRTLLIWEESHFAQSIGNQPDYFRHKNAFDVSGSTSQNGMADVYVISVSATPFSEISDEVHYSQGKRIVKMEPGDGYIGVSYFYEHGSILPIPRKKSTNHWYKLLESVMKRWAEHPVPKYHIFRGTDKGRDPTRQRMTELALRLGFRLLNHTSQYSDLHWDVHGKEVSGMSCLVKKPAQHTIIFIKNMCRMGKVVPKHHIGFVFESPTTDSHTDTILQGLLGRMCGYDFGDNTISDIEIYVPEAMFTKVHGMNQLERYIRFFQHADMLPTKAMNLCELPRAMAMKRRFTEKRYVDIPNLCDITPYDNVPVLIPRENRGDRFVENGESDGDELIADILNNIDLFYKHNYPEHVDDLLRSITGRSSISHRKLSARSAYVKQKRDVQMYQAIQHRTGVQLWTDVDKIQVCEMLSDYESTKVPLRAGDLLVCWACIPLNPTARRACIVESSFPKTNGKEVFRPQEAT